MSTSVRQPDERDYWPDNEITVKIGEWSHAGGKQPVVFLSFNKYQTAVLNYEAVVNLLDLLCRQKERLQEKIYKQMNIPEKVLQFGKKS